MLNPDDNTIITTLIREELARRNKTRQWLADTARISISTLEKGLSGRRAFTLSTLVKIEESLGLSLRTQDSASNVHQLPINQNQNQASTVAPDSMGSYSKRQVEPLMQRYLTVRPSFSQRKNCLFSYVTTIAWDDALGHLVFEESDRIDADYTQRGLVAVPHKSGHIYLSTNRHGQQRMVTLSKPNILDEMFGVLSSLMVKQASQMSPVACPIALAPLTSYPTPILGLVEQHQPPYKDYTALLRKAVGEGYCSFVV